MKISVVAPLYNSAKYIKELHRRCAAAVAATGTGTHEIILVNDGRPDDGLTIAKQVAAGDPQVIVVDLSRNFGQHKAIVTGLRYATGDYVFVIDSDLDERPEWITMFYAELIAKQCDVIYGISSKNEGRTMDGFFRAIFYSLLNSLSGVTFPKNITNARIMTRRYVDAMLQFDEREIYLGGLWHITGFEQRPFPVQKSYDSPTSYNQSRLIALVINAVTGFSTRPLIMISIIGLLVATFGHRAFGLGTCQDVRIWRERSGGRRLWR